MFAAKKTVATKLKNISRQLIGQNVFESEL